MKRILTVLLVLTCLLGTVACSPAKGGAFFEKNSVVRATASTMPKSQQYNCVFEGDKLTALVDFLAGLELISDFSDNPDEYYGMVWDIRLNYSEGEDVSIKFFETFIRFGSGKWYKISDSERLQLQSLLNDA